jgi:hypothetical protein
MGGIPAGSFLETEFDPFQGRYKLARLVSGDAVTGY